MADAFFVRLDADRFESTPCTRGPWDPDSQHAGPPAALLGLAVQQRPGAREDMRLVRLTYEILRPVPIRPLTVTTRVLRSGRSTELVEAVLVPDGAEQEVMRATCLRIRTDPGAVPEVSPAPTLGGPEQAGPDSEFAFPWEVGYHTAMELRFAAGSFAEPGPATGWLRMRVPLVAGEPTTPLSRVLVAADSTNGLSGAVDFRRYVYVNPDLTVHLHRHPAGEWVALEARTSVDPAGIGVAESVLHDEKGPIGRAVQSLYVAPRS